MANINDICKVLVLGSGLLLSSCVKDDLYNTSHPGKGAVEVTTDWTGCSSDAVLPDSYVLCIGETKQSVSGGSNHFETLFSPEKHDLLIYHQAEGFTLNGNIANVNTLPDGTLEPLPDYLFSGNTELNVPEDDTLKVTVPMRQYIRELILTLRLAPDDEERIIRTSAALGGIASAVDLVTGNVVAAKGRTVIPAFSVMPDNSRTRAIGQSVLSATLHLVGVVAEESQVLVLDIMMADGNVHTITTDLTDLLKHFDKGVDPMELDASLELPVGSGFSATIADWVAGNGNNGEAGSAE